MTTDHASSPIVPRPVSAGECALLSRMLGLAIEPDLADGYRAQLDALRVVARCNCGCPSVLFDAPRPTGTVRRSMVADVYGTTREGFAVGLLLWAVAGQLEYLEVYALGDWPTYGLPAPDTVTAEYPSAPPEA